MGLGDTAENEVRVVGRYALHGAIASGGMATVHLGRLLGPVGFSRTVAIKRLHAQFAADAEFVSMFLDEARLAARIRHPNVVPTLDVVATAGELFLVMEYVPGESLARLMRRSMRDRPPLRILTAVMAGVLHGLHAAHEAKDERGVPLGIVHRDVSPQNVLVGTDGNAKLLDFGVAKAAGRVQSTRDGEIKGKLSYMPPEQLTGGAVSRQTDIYAAGVILWELVAGQRLFSGEHEGVIVSRVLEGTVTPPSLAMSADDHRPTLDVVETRALAKLDAIILRALDRDPDARFRTAKDLAIELERALHPATASEVGEWVERTAHDVLETRAARVAEVESAQAEPIDSHSLIEQIALTASQSGPHASIPSMPSIQRPIPRGAPLEPVFPVTQPSSISVAQASQASQVPAGSRWPVLALGFVAVSALLGAGVLGAKVLGQRQATPARTVTLPPAVAVPRSLQNTPTSQDDGLGAQADPLINTGVPPSSPTVGTASGPPTVPRATTTPRRPAPPKATATASAPPANECNPPYYFEGGVKKYKPNCI